MTDSILSIVKKMAKVDIFTEAKRKELFVGRPFYLDYGKANILIADAWKIKVSGIPQGTLLLAFYENETNVSEALLLRAIKPSPLPTDNSVTSSMVEYYKDNLKTTEKKDSELDDFTRYEFSFSGLECSILGTFYKNGEEQVVFGADVENFYSAHNYMVYKPVGKVLEYIVNLKDGSEIAGGVNDVKIGKIRYSSTKRFQDNLEEVSVYISPKDFLGKRTALFGMTRTGKSNTVKKIIESTSQISAKSKLKIESTEEKDSELLDSFDNQGNPKFPVGQIIFDINGEYANANMQDEGTAIFEMYKDKVERYSVIPKNGFKVMKVNFYTDVEGGFDLVKNHLSNMGGDYVSSFTAIDLTRPEDIDEDNSLKTRYERKVACYLCSLFKAGFSPPDKFSIKFKGNKELNELAGGIDPSGGISLNEACNWFTSIWENSEGEYFVKYRKDKGRDWIDEDLKSLLVFLTKKPKPNKTASVSGYLKLRALKELHTNSIDNPFEQEIIDALRKGNIIILDLSQGEPEIQRLYSKRITKKIFNDSMARFIKNLPNNYIQFYFEEAHNLFPQKEDKDLSKIYNRVAKEGAKLNLGLIYATQEVSSISSNILKNTQNWFIAHLNNYDEIKELKKYYDFDDFSESLLRFSAGSDKGFVRMKTYSNPFVVPVQIDRFSAKREK